MKLNPHDTRHRILSSAIGFMLEKGYENTHVKDICDELKISPGNLTYHYPTKEHILLEITKILTGFHRQSMENVIKNEGDKLTAYCREVVCQIAMCEVNPQARDLYLNMYSAPMSMNYIKDWTAEKNLEFLGEYLPELTLKDFRKLENVSCCIERSALAEPCNEDYTLEEKIALTLESILKLYDFPKAKCKELVSEMLKADYIEISKAIWSEFSALAKEI